MMEGKDARGETMMGGEDLLRVQFEMSQKRLHDLDRVKAAAGIRTRRELFDNAFTLFEWAVQQAMRGWTVAAVDEETGQFQPLLMPALSNARRDAKSPPQKLKRARRDPLVVNPRR